MATARIVMVGTALDTQGGVSAVAGALKAGGLFSQFAVEYIASHCEGGRLRKLVRAVRAWLYFLLLLLPGRVALVHLHMASRASFWRKLAFFLSAFASNVPVIVHLHGGEFPLFYGKESLPLVRRLIRFVFEHASRVIVLSHTWREWVMTEFPKAHVSVVYNPVVLEAPTACEARDAAMLLVLGRLGKGKGTYDLLEAIVILAERFPRLQVLLGGDGELESIRSRAAALGIADKVRLLGWVRGDDKRALLARASLYVLPSYHEGLPMSVLEAMAAGLPVVATPVGGIPEAVCDGVEGFLVQPGDVVALADRVGRLLADADLRQRMGEAGRRKVEQLFAVEKIVPQISAIYAELRAGNIRVAAS